MRITFISDTHGMQGYLTDDLIGGDIIIHAGDISNVGHLHEIEFFCMWFDSLPYTHKIFIAGNHDWGFEKKPDKVLEILKDYKTITYLQDDFVIIDDVKIYGSPYQPEFMEWAFNLPRFGNSLENKWSEIPEDTDILVTHGPPHAILDDASYTNRFLGCTKLKERVEAIKPKIHTFGHIHGGYGYKEGEDIHYINASSLNEKYVYTNKPITIDWNPLTNEIIFV